MKDQRDRSNMVRSAASSGKSLQTLYHELLDLREEVRDAELRWREETDKSQKQIRKIKHKH